MAAKKGGAVALQQDVTTDEEWEALLHRPGLLLVDVYSEWCGPCVGMAGNLKKIKVEIGGDMLILATARADNITALERHRNHSEPIWMVIAGGKLINLIFGADAPRIARLIATELETEVKVQKGQATREFMSWDELTPEEEARLKAAEEKRLKALAEEEERLAASLNQMRIENYSKLAEKLLRYTVVLFLPAAVSDGRASEVLGPLKESWSQAGLEVRRDVTLPVTADMANEMFFERKLPQHNDLVVALEAGPCQALLLYKPPVEIVQPPSAAPSVEEAPTSPTVTTSPIDMEAPAPGPEGDDTEPSAEPDAEEVPREGLPAPSAPQALFDSLESGEVEALVARTLYGFCPPASADAPLSSQENTALDKADVDTKEETSTRASGGAGVLGGAWNRSDIMPAVDSPAALCLRAQVALGAEGDEGRAAARPALPGLWTPLTPLTKAAAMQALFPEDTKLLTLPPPSPPSHLPPSLVFVWEAARAKEVLVALAAAGATSQLDAAVTGRGFFSENLELLGGDEAEYEGKGGVDRGGGDGDRFVLAVDCEADGALQTIGGLPSGLQPCSASADRAAGAADVARYFPVLRDATPTPASADGEHNDATATSEGVQGKAK